jgi:hypothetical protein
MVRWDLRMSCRNFNFEGCFDDCVEELFDRDASQRAAQEPADPRFDQLATIGARTRVSRSETANKRAFWSSHWVRAIFWYAGLVVLACSSIGLLAFRGSSNLCGCNEILDRENSAERSH